MNEVVQMQKFFEDTVTDLVCSSSITHFIYCLLIVIQCSFSLRHLDEPLEDLIGMETENAQV